MESAAENQPFTNTRFRVEIEGVGATDAFEVVFPQARVATRPRSERKTEYGTLILRRGLTRSSAWYDWWHGARQARRRAGRSVVIALLDEQGATAIRWTYAGAQPIGYLVSSLHALGNEPVIETLELSVAEFHAAFAPATSGPKRA